MNARRANGPETHNVSLLISVAGSPHERRKDNKIEKSLTRPIDRGAVVFWTPGSAINVNMVRIQTERLRLDRIIDAAIQHAHA